jgi:GDP-4-dehydro-6-deoxy-D-mannose reductase
VKAPRLAWDVNLGGTLNLVLAIREHAPKAHLLYVSSAEVYGASLNSSAPATEQTLLQPLNPYAASKAAADILVRQAAADGLSATVMRPFNHTGAGQSESFVAPSFAAQIARIEAGIQPPVLSVGSLDEERDFLDVRDVVRAYAMALDARGTLTSGEVFNVASGRAVRIGDLLERLLRQARTLIEVRVDPERLRRASIPKAIGDPTRLRTTLNWVPEVELDDTLSAVLDDQRRCLSSRN